MRNRTDFKDIHPDFKLNGIHYKREELTEVAYSLIKEGTAYELRIGDFLMDWLSDQEFLEVRTSGSTGDAKIIRLQKQHMVNSALATGTFFEKGAKTTALLCLPAAYIAGKMMLVRAMVLGWALDYVPPSSRPLAANRKSYDFTAMVPLQAEQSVKELDSIGTLLLGGAPVSYNLQQMLQNTSAEVFETYGMTETITHIAARRVDGSQSPENNPFMTLPGITISKDTRGCLIIDAPKIAKEPIATNDMVELRSETEFVWLGRFDHIINSGGIKINPEAVEAKLAAVLTHSFIVVGLPDERLGESVALIVEEGFDTDKLLKRLSQLSNLEKYEVPKQVFQVPRLMTTENGKIQREQTALLLKK